MTTYQYVVELKDKHSESAKIAAENADISSSRYKTYFDLKSQDRKFDPGDEVLVLLPDSSGVVFTRYWSVRMILIIR
jgi:hypothetical protein